MSVPVSGERFLTKWLPGHPDLVGVRVLTDTGAQIDRDTVQVRQTSGPSSLGVAWPTVNVTCYVPRPDRAAVLDLAAAVVGVIEHDLRGVSVGVTVRDRPFRVTAAWLRTVTAPVWLPYENTQVRAALFVVDLITHTHPL